MDPNWFYSTLAQSAAAIVGLVGGFFGSKIIEQASQVKERRSGIKREIDSLNAKISQARADAQNSQIQLRAETAKYIESGGQTKQIFGSNSLGPLMSGVSIEMPVSKDIIEKQRVTLDCLSGFIKFYDEYFEKGGIPKLPFPPWRSEEFYSMLRKIQDSGVKEIASKLGATISELDGEYDGVVMRYAEYMDQVMPKYFYIMLVILGFLSVAGVIAPLSMLSGEIRGSNSIKAILLILFSIGMVSMLVFFAYQIYHVRNIGKISSRGFETEVESLSRFIFRSSGTSKVRAWLTSRRIRQAMQRDKKGKEARN